MTRVWIWKIGRRAPLPAAESDMAVDGRSPRGQDTQGTKLQTVSSPWTY
jgi:hypothetical protein